MQKIVCCAVAALQTSPNLRNPSLSVGAMQPIGHVIALNGGAVVVRADGLRTRLNFQDFVYQGDIIATEPSATISLRFIDRSAFLMHGAARVALDELVFNSIDQAYRSTNAVSKGIFAVISGRIAAAGSKSNSVTAATIGIRG